MTVSVAASKQREGAPEGRVEDRRLLTGRGRFVDDLRLEGEAYMGLVRSPYAHAKINSIDFSKARESPDFIASLTGEDLLKEGVQPLSQNPWPFQKRAKRYHLAVGKARFAGEPVAAILVRNKSSVEDLIELVEVDYESLPVVTTIEESKHGKAIIYEDWGNNSSLTGEVKKGDVEKAIASAAFVIHAREGMARQVAAPMEPHAVLVEYDGERDVYEVWATVQTVHGTRDKLARELKLPKEKFHVRVMDMGGGFGSKGAQSYPEAPLACIFSRRTGRPVKWTATRSEEFLEAAAGRDEYCDITLACDKEGKMVAVKASVECDLGVTGSQVHMPTMTIETMSGPYRIPNQDLTVAGYVTNKMPIGPVRGAGVPEGCYFIERAVDALARKAGLDPIEFRRRNVARREGPAEGEADFTLLLDTLVRSAHYEELVRWRSDLYSKFKLQGASHSNLLGGLGVSVTGGDESDDGDEDEGDEDWSAVSPGGGQMPWQPGGGSGGGERWAGQTPGAAGSTWQTGGAERPGTSQSTGESQERPAWPGAGEETLGFMSETARITLDKNGKVTVYTGSSPHGQGEETTFAQLASEELGVALEDVTVVWGDTALIPRGIGTFGSRSAATGGSAVVEASRKLRAQLVARASEALGADEKSLAMRDGAFVRASRPDEVLARLGDILAKQRTDEISASSVFTLSGLSYSSGVHLCALTVDLELGKVKIVRYFVVEDCGRMINRTIVEGQLHGGVLHAVGGALFEGLAYDEGGNLLSSTFMDYNIPAAPDSPEVQVFHETTPSTVTLDGVKGVGESGTNGAYAAVINALNDALSQLGTGAEVNMVPATPEAVFRALNAKPVKTPTVGDSS
jgi:aerobic carbon-monoxide dehydrogenase large subunit